MPIYAPTYKCYLVVIHKVTGYDEHGQPQTKFIGADAWSGLPQNQSRYIDGQMGSVLWETQGVSFQEAYDKMTDLCKFEHFRFKWALKWIDDNLENWTWRKQWTEYNGTHK